MGVASAEGTCWLSGSGLQTSEMPAGVTDNASVTFYQNTKDPSEGWAFTEAVNGSLAVERETLATRGNVGRALRGKGLKGDLVSAHPKLMPNGEHVNIMLPVPFGEIQVRS